MYGTQYIFIEKAGSFSGLKTRMTSMSSKIGPLHLMTLQYICLGSNVTHLDDVKCMFGADL